MKRIGRTLALAALAAVAAPARPGLFAVAALGEAASQSVSDDVTNTVLPQIGMSLEYRTRFLSVFNTPTVGYYNRGPMLEDYLGVEVGWTIGWARPALTGGLGVQGFFRTKYDYESDVSWRKHAVSFPLGIGLRLGLSQSSYGEWQGRMVRLDHAGVPWWKMEFGYRLI